LLGLNNKITLVSAIALSGFSAISSLVILFIIFKKSIDYESNRTQKISLDWRYLVSYLSTFQFIFIYRFPASFVISASEIANLSVAFSFAFFEMKL
jgi:hypothetical protein